MSYCLQCGHKAERKIPPTDNMPRLACPNCHYIHYENPKVICGSLVVHEDRVLLCRRAIEPQYGLWTIPAGFMENGETMRLRFVNAGYQQHQLVFRKGACEGGGIALVQLVISNIFKSIKIIIIICLSI